MSESETIVTGSLYEYWAETYDDNKIKDRFGLSFDEYINRPSALITSLNATAERLDAADIERLEKLKTEIK